MELNPRLSAGEIPRSSADATRNAAPSAASLNADRPVEFRGKEHWYAAYTNANHEKCVVAQLAQTSVEHFLPTYPSLRRWKDRQTILHRPLFPGYVFVRVALCDRLRVLRIPGVVRLVGFSGLPAALPEQEINALRHSLTHALRFEPHPHLRIGQRVRIRTGPLQGLEGILARKKAGLRFVISLDLLMRSVATEIDVAQLETVQ